ncbi:hypothetical protein [Pontibacter akesuensis]|uniref:Tissue inhibitor of metalloproteinase n=1 Tax=Pontibacter akesuensis TaxID=388950 RepID=A0A1I7KH09_9BACT|nr:hypothetical protein [Pontibacter akesuensis]GHA79108.1 hypothetical protein GCM10007389_36540 [Pontibacter akesuensis]SFU96723.1 hypothetical protein SAMN04487941_3734 [Pontibacter akesuensis]
MKYLLVVIFLFPLYTLANSCDPPLVALEFLTSKYVFWGTVVKKEYAEDSSTYKVTLQVEKHLKTIEDNPKTFTFTKKAEGSYTGISSSFEFHMDKGEKWLVCANYYKGELVFSYYCSNSKPYTSMDAIPKQELEILEAGESIDLDKIVFESMTSRLSTLKEYKGPEPITPLDSLLALVDKKYYDTIPDNHFENIIVSINTKGEISTVAVHRKVKNFKIKEVYGVMYPAYTPIDSLDTELQKEIMSKLNMGKKWKPATFMGRKVNSQVHLQVYFKPGKAPYSSPVY